MAKATNDLILRDRLQFNIENGSDVGTIYGRFNLDDYVSIIEKKGMRIKQILFQFRDPNNAGTVNMTNSGIGFEMGASALWSDSIEATGGGGVKLFATTTAYQNGADVGIASPGVYAIEEWKWLAYTTEFNTSPAPDNGVNNSLYTDHRRYGVEDMHPYGVVVISDLLIGICADNWGIYQDGDVVELDVQLIAEPTSVSAKDMTELLIQGSDN